MILKVDPAAAVPVTEQIRRQVTRLVVSGQLGPGTQLPPIRQLAADLGVARGTVARAYDLLHRDGVVETQGRHGTIVKSVGEPAGDEALDRSADALALIGHQLGLDVDRAIAALRKAWGRLEPDRS